MLYHVLVSQHLSDVIWTPELCLVTTGMKSLNKIIFLRVVNIAALYIFFFDFGISNFYLDEIIYHNCISSVKFKEIIFP